MSSSGVCLHFNGDVAKKLSMKNCARYKLLVELAVQAPDVSGAGKLGDALRKLISEVPSVGFDFDAESGIAILFGESEAHVGFILEKLQKLNEGAVTFGQPQVAYREALSKHADIDYTHKKQSGGSGQFARVKIEFEPLDPGSGFQFESKVVGGNVPKDFIPGVEKGLNVAKENGLLAGYPMTDFKATLYDGAYHDVDSSVLAFEIAARAAFRELKSEGEPRLMEPIMKVEVVTPEDYMGDIIGDLNSRRGQIQGSEPRGNATAINAFVPLANMFGYAGDLWRISHGRAQFTMQFQHYTEAIRCDGEDPQPPAARTALVA